MTITRALRSIFQSDAVSAGTAVFPEILVNRIASDLKLEEAGGERGLANQPSSDATTFDSVENSIIDQVARYRREGLQAYEDHKRLYADRLSRVGEAHRELRIASDSARDSFFASALMSKSALVNAQRKVTDSFHHLSDFRQKNALIRPAKPMRIFPAVALAIFFLVIESLLNSFLLAQAHEFGLLGGAITAALIAIVNIGVSGILGWQCRWINSVNATGRMRGYFTILVFVVFALMFNLMIGHFRDALSSSQDMERAAILGKL